MVYLLWLWQLVIHPWPGSCLNFDNPSRDKTHSHPTSKGILQGDTVWPAWTLHQIWYTGKWFPWQRFELLHPLCAVVGCWLCHAGLDVSVIVCHDIVCVTGSVMTSCDTSIWYTEWPLQRILDFAVLVTSVIARCAEVFISFIWMLWWGSVLFVDLPGISSVTSHMCIWICIYSYTSCICKQRCWITLNKLQSPCMWCSTLHLQQLLL